jgi:hypothetical protein
MEVYIVTSGSYSDYSIEAVFLDEDKASVYQALHFPNDGIVEIFDTDEFQVETSIPVYREWLGMIEVDGEIKVKEYGSFTIHPMFEVADSYISTANKIVRFTTNKNADEEAARKILSDKLAEWKYENEV